MPSRYFSDEKFRAKIKAQHAATKAAFEAMSPEDRAEHRRRTAERQRWTKYGINAELFDAIFALQSECCAICETDKPGSKRWHIDHDHKTGRVRGILCRRCNVTLGFAADNEHVLFAMAEYLIESRNRSSEVRTLITNYYKKSSILAEQNSS